MRSEKTNGFTLVELLVVIAVIGLLVALLLPALNSVREAARSSVCTSNFKQIALAMQTYESARRAFPPSRSGMGGWSAQAVITPFLEQGHIFEGIDFSVSYKEISLKGMPISAYRVPVYNCPSESNTQLRPDDDISHAPINYVVNMGTWEVWDPAAKQGGNGLFYPERGVSVRRIADGLSNTAMLSEVKTYNPYYRDGGLAGPTMPTNPSEICGFAEEGEFKTNSGHTEWVDGRVHQTGFTATFTPNTKVRCNGADVDFNNYREGEHDSTVCYAAVTARSHHPGKVHVASGTGSVYAIGDEIDLPSWQAFATRDSKDAVGTMLSQ